MSLLNKQELQVVEAFSSADLPEHIYRDSNIKELINNMTKEQKAVHDSADKLEGLRREQKDGNFLTNWWNDREDALQDAQIDLNKSIGRLTQKSSQLLIVNTALSKLLNQQQHILLKQQGILEDQTNSLADQNEQILKQQLLLEEQQKEINKANQGLLEAKGVTQEQAIQLVGCVKRVIEAENKISEANTVLLAEIEQRVVKYSADLFQPLQSDLDVQVRRHSILEQKMEETVAVQQGRVETIQQSLSQAQQLSHKHLLAEIEQNRQALNDSSKSVVGRCNELQQELSLATNDNINRQRSIENDVAVLQVQFIKSQIRHRFVLIAMTCAVVLSIGWQIAQHFLIF